MSEHSPLSKEFAALIQEAVNACISALKAPHSSEEAEAAICGTMHVLGILIYAVAAHLPEEHLQCALNNAELNILAAARRPQRGPN